MKQVESLSPAGALNLAAPVRDREGRLQGGSTVYSAALHNFALFVSLCTFILLVVGGLVTSTGSGLAVPDWPLSYGRLMPPMVGGIFYEHTHRMVATFVGILTVVLTVSVFRTEKRRWMKVLASAGLVAVIIQGLLGGLTVKMLLPTWVSTTHAMLAQTFFALICSIALFTSRWWGTAVGIQAHANSAERRTVELLVLLVPLLYVQLGLGATMRHDGAGLAIPDYPLSYGQLIPSVSAEALSNYNRELIAKDIRIYADGPISAGQILLNYFHRTLAIVVCLVVLASAIRLVRLRSVTRRFAYLGLALGALVIVQFSLGALTVLSRLAVPIATAHQSTGALVLMLTIVSLLHLVRVRRWKL